MLNLRRHSFIGLLFAVLFFAISCTRSSDSEQPAKISLSIPTQKTITRKISTVLKSKNKSKKKFKTAKNKSKKKAESFLAIETLTLSHVIINISGPGMPSTTVCHLDLEHNKRQSGPCDFSQFPVVSLSAEKGTGRLFQVGLAYMDELSGSLYFEYGDATKDLVPGDNSISITMADIDTSGEQGHISGRYLTSANDGPTGTLEVKIKPSNGRPSLTLMKTEIFSGWFQAFSMSGAKFEYVVNNSTLLWGQAIDKGFLESLQSANQPVSVSSNSSGYEAIGFFGGSEFVAGKAATASGTCSAGTEYISCLKSGSYFTGPFKKLSSNSGMVSYSNNLLQWSLLPGVENVISNFRVLYNPNSPMENETFLENFVLDSSQLDCAYMQNYEGTQVLAESLAISTSSISVSNLNESSLVAVCPRNSAGFYFSALTYPSLSSGQNSAEPYLWLQVDSLDSSNGAPTMTTNECYPATLGLYLAENQGQASAYPAPAGGVQINDLGNPDTGAPWVSFYSDPDCAVDLANGLSIVEGGYYSNEQFYVKATLPGSSLGLAPTVVSTDSSVTFASSSNRFNVENPVLVVTGPATMVNSPAASPATQICYRADLALQNAHGYGFDNLDPVQVQFDFGSDYVLYADIADCQTGTAPQTAGYVEIPAHASTLSVFIKRTDTTTDPIPLVFSATDFNDGQLNVTGSNGSKFGAKFIFEPVGSQEIGKCNMVKVKHVNAAGDLLPIQLGLLVKISSSIPNFVAMGDESCYSPLSNQEIFFMPGDSEIPFYYRGTIASSISFDANGGIVNGSSSPITVAIPADVDQPYLTWTLPQIKSYILGSHDFPKTIAITPSSGAVVECETANQPYSSWSPCDGSNFDSSSNVFTWNAIDSIFNAPKGFRFVVSKNDHQATYEFIPEQLYTKEPSHPFNVVACDITLSADGTNDLDEIETALVSHNKICLNAGTFIGGPTASWILGNEEYIIGKTDSTGEPTSTIQADPGAALIAPADTSYLANVSIIGAGSGSPAAIISLAAGAGTFTSANNIFTTTTYHPKAISLTDADLELNSLGDRFILDGSTGHHYGIYVGQIPLGATVGIFNPIFNLTSGTSTYARAIGVYQSDVVINVESAKLDSSLRDGAFIDVDQNGVTTVFASITIAKSNLYFSSATNNLNRFPFYLSYKTTLNFNNTIIQSAMSSQTTIKSFQTANDQLDLAFFDSKFVQHSDLDFTFLNTSTFTQNIFTDNVQFIRTGSAGSNASVLGLTAGFTWGTNSLVQPNDTRFCGTAGTNWYAVHSGGSITGGILISAALPAITDTADLTNLVCQ